MQNKLGSMFRKLKANEVEVRVGPVSAKGLTLLLYKNSRVDMAILDETVGAMNWSRNQEVIGQGLYCSVGIRDENGVWIFKSDVGTESNQDAVKGCSADAFKRACINWGIGRELYTAPHIFVMNGDKYDKFTCTNIGYGEDGSITDLTIYSKKEKKVVFNFVNGKQEYLNSNNGYNNGYNNNSNNDIKTSGITDKQVGRLKALTSAAKVNIAAIEKQVKAKGFNSFQELDKATYDNLCNKLQAKIDEIKMQETQTQQGFDENAI